MVVTVCFLSCQCDVRVNLKTTHFIGRSKKVMCVSSYNQCILIMNKDCENEIRLKESKTSGTSN